MAEGGGDGGGPMDGGGDGDAARGGDFTPAGEYLSALRLRPLGAGVAKETRARRRGRRALCRRYSPRVPSPGGSRPLSGRTAGTVAEVWAGIASRQNAPDRVRAVCRAEPEKTRRRQARDVRLSGLHAYQREDPERGFHGTASDGPQAPARESAGNQAATPAAHA